MPDFSDFTGDLVRLAVDAAVMRQQAIANNIANANSRSYAPKRVSFEDRLALEKAAFMDRRGDAVNRARLKSLKPEIVSEPELGASGSLRQVKLDMEIAELNKTVVQYQALLEGLAKKGSLIKMAIDGGRK